MSKYFCVAPEPNPVKAMTAAFQGPQKPQTPDTLKTAHKCPQEQRRAESDPMYSVRHLRCSEAAKLAILSLPSPYCPAKVCYSPHCLRGSGAVPRPHRCPPKWAQRYDIRRLLNLLDIPGVVRQLLILDQDKRNLVATAEYLESLRTLLIDIADVYTARTAIPVVDPAKPSPSTNKRDYRVEPWLLKDMLPRARRREIRRRVNLIRRIVRDERRFVRFLALRRREKLMTEREQLAYEEHALFQRASTATLLKALEPFKAPKKALTKEEKEAFARFDF